MGKGMELCKYYYKIRMNERVNEKKWFETAKRANEYRNFNNNSWNIQMENVKCDKFIFK